MPSYFEKRILQEMQNIEAKIEELHKEKAALGRLLIKAKMGLEGTKYKIRKNSLDRLMIEKRISEILSRENKSTSSRVLYEEARLIKTELKQATFRTYLHRMKIKGLIEPDKSINGWKIIQRKVLIK